MTTRRDAEAALADDLEAVARALREGEATVYGYRVREDPRPHRTGGIAYADGWLEFRLEPDAADPDDA